MLPMAGVGSRAEDVLGMMVFTGEVVEIALFNIFVEAVDGLEVR
jgi:hypothetical protein